MNSNQPDITAVKERLSAVWSAGDWGTMARIIEQGGIDFINRLGIKKGDKAADVACGDGNLSIAAAKLGAEVWGSDLVPAWIEMARERAKKENLEIQFEIADAESLPYKDNEFDWVVSMFGAMFAPRPEVAASELVRVCKPGGKIAMANWTPEGFIGKMFKIAAEHVPPPAGVPSPVLWGVEDKVRERFGRKVSELSFKRRMLQMSLPMPPEETVEFYRKFFGPTKKAFEALDEDNQLKYRNELIELWKEYNIAGKEITTVDAEYLEIIATKST